MESKKGAGEPKPADPLRLGYNRSSVKVTTDNVPHNAAYQFRLWSLGAEAQPPRLGT